jgi:AbrB family looped-hinge helix DNA binding protein
MSELKTTKLSSKGQLIIPEEVRQKLGLKSGDEFVVVAEDDVIMLKSINKPSLDEFQSLIDQARESAKQAGLTKQSVQDAINQARDK